MLPRPLSLQLYLSLFLICLLGQLKGQEAQAVKPVLRKLGVSVLGVAVLDTHYPIKYGFAGIAALNFEAGIFTASKQRFKITGSLGFTPPLTEGIDYAFNVGPKAYWNCHGIWLTMDVRYWGIWDETIKVHHNGNEPILQYIHAGYVSTGCCFMISKNISINPALCVGGSHVKFRDIRQYAGLNLVLGYWVK